MSELEFARPPVDMLIDAHAEQRAKERFGDTLSDADKVDMIDQIRSARGIFVASKPNSRKVKIWLVWWRSSSRIVPVYFKDGKILSVLPLNSVASLTIKSGGAE